MMSECKCDMRTKLVGDGCSVCNPELALHYAQENIEELEQDKTDLELAVHTSLANLNDEISGLKEDKEEMLGELERLALSPSMDMGTKQDIKALIARMEGK